MKNRRPGHLFALIECSILALLAACGSLRTNGYAPSVSGAAAPREIDAKPAAELFVSNLDDKTITVYKPGTSSPVLSITAGIDYALSLAFDKKADLYVANYNTACVTVYAPGSKKVFRTINKRIQTPIMIAFDQTNGHLDVLNGAYGTFTGNVTVYSSAGKYLRTVATGVKPFSLAIDSKGNIYVASLTGGTAGSVLVYSPTTGKQTLQITGGLSIPQVIGLDRSDDLYVVNAPNSSDEATIQEYLPGKIKPVRTIVATGVQYPTALAFDAVDNVYLLNQGQNVEVYAEGSNKLLRTITSGLKNPVGLAFGPNNYLNVANEGNGFSSDPGSVTQYAPGSGGVARKITDGIEGPYVVTYSP